MLHFGREFYKLSGSGNDFVAFDEMHLPSDAPEPTPEAVQALCRRGIGVGADGVVLLRAIEGADYQLVYYNADGTRATLCGNASLCGVRLAVELGHADPADVSFVADAGPMRGRIHGGLPEIDVAPPVGLHAERTDLLGDDEPGRHGDPARVGFVRVGVPHVVILCADASRVDVERAGPPIRHHASLHDGANVNYASALGDGLWMVRTYERGVEAETLACGTGSVATATLLAAWGAAPGPAASDAPGSAAASAAPIEIITRSGLVHRVRHRIEEDGRLAPSLAGAAAVVFRGSLGEGRW